MTDTDEPEETDTEKSGQQKMADTLANYMTRNWTRAQIVEFCLSCLGEEARAWWNRKEMKQS